MWHHTATTAFQQLEEMKSPGDLSPLPQITELTRFPPHSAGTSTTDSQQVPGAVAESGSSLALLCYRQCSKALQGKQITPYTKTKDEQVINSWDHGGFKLLLNQNIYCYFFSTKSQRFFTYFVQSCSLSARMEHFYISASNHCRRQELYLIYSRQNIQYAY